jgi:MFS family permease
MEDKGSFYYKWIALGVSFITLALTSTIIHSFPFFFVALLKEFGWSRSITAGAFSLFFILYGVIAPFAGRTVDRFGPRRVFVLGSLLWGLGLALCSLMHSWWQFYVCFGVIAAIGAGFTGWVPNTTAVQNWFKGKKGLPIGILSSGVGIEMFVCIPVIQYVINVVGWRMAYRVMALFIPLVVITMTIVFLKKPQRITSSTQTEQETYNTMMRDPLIIDLKWASRSWTLRQAIVTKQFWALSVCFFFNNLVNYSISAHHVAFFVDAGLEPLFVSCIVAIIGVVSIGGKIFWGTLSDRIGREIAFALTMACCISGILVLIVFPFLSSPHIVYVYALIFGMGYSGMMVLPPIITADFFQGRAYGSIFGTIYILNSGGGAFGAWLGGFLHDHVGNYMPLFIIAIACALFACFNIWIAAPRKIRIVPGKRVFRFKRDLPS